MRLEKSICNESYDMATRGNPLDHRACFSGCSSLWQPRAYRQTILDALMSSTAPEVYFVHVAPVPSDGLAAANLLHNPLTLPCCSLEDTLPDHTNCHGSYFVDRSYVHAGCRMAGGKHLGNSISVEANVYQLGPRSHWPGAPRFKGLRFKAFGLRRAAWRGFGLRVEHGDYRSMSLFT